MKPTKAEMTLWILLDNIEYEVLVTGNLYPGRPGKYSGPPESCYEDESPEWEIISLEWETQPHRELTQEEEEDIFDRSFSLALDGASDGNYDDEGYSYDPDDEAEYHIRY